MGLEYIFGIFLAKIWSVKQTDQHMHFWFLPVDLPSYEVALEPRVKK